MDAAGGNQAPQRLLTAGQLPSAEAVNEVELITHPPGNLGATDQARLGQQDLQCRDGLLAAQSSVDAMLIDRDLSNATNHPFLLIPREVGHGQGAHERPAIPPHFSETVHLEDC